jgi:hypothetical protein
MMSRQRSNLAVAYLELGMKIWGGKMTEIEARTRGGKNGGLEGFKPRQRQESERRIRRGRGGGLERNRWRDPVISGFGAAGCHASFGLCRQHVVGLGRPLVRGKSGRGFEGVSGRKASCDRAANSLDPRQTPRQCNGAVTYQELRR